MNKLILNFLRPFIETVIKESTKKTFLKKIEENKASFKVSFEKEPVIKKKFEEILRSEKTGLKPRRERSRRILKSLDL